MDSKKKVRRLTNQKISSHLRISRRTVQRWWKVYRLQGFALLPNMTSLNSRMSYKLWNHILLCKTSYQAKKGV